MRPKFICFLAFAVVAVNGSLLHAQAKSLPSQSMRASKTSTASIPVPPARLAKIEQMLTLTGLKPNLEEKLSEEQSELKWYAHVQTSIFPKVPADKELKEKEVAATYIKDMNAVAESQLTWDQVKPAIIRFCADNFTDEQMDSIIAFYSSPTGRIILEKGKGLNETTAAAMRDREIRTKSTTNKSTEEMRAKVQPLLPPAPKSPSPSTSSELRAAPSTRTPSAVSKPN